ncbi:aromatic amino acid lyase [Vulcanisaeta sp. JCM 14467]|uniref:aromatic amino acid lyase n=1 Tax=Vulcanisaeta sp. JCM 14467 TaxID=1295370 RepID=UPI000A485015|nr:aromatic amino acid lyase [Vulcanisaeta sp. JCM 14467]
MLTQYTAAALSARLRELAMPSTVQNIPTSGFQEDINSMSANSAMKLHEVNSSIAQLIAILAYDTYVVANANNACRNCGKITTRVYDIISKYVSGAQSHNEAITRLVNAIDELSSLVDLRINP